MGGEASDADLERLINGNIESITEIRAHANRQFGAHSHMISRLTRRMGRPFALYLLLAAIAVWISANLIYGSLGHDPVDPPPFVWLQGVATVSALIASITILVGQNRQGQLSERRSEFELQVNLLAAQRSAKIVSLLEELRRDLPNVRNRADPEAQTLAMTESPQVVAEAVSRAMLELETAGTVNDATWPLSPPRGAGRGGAG